MMEVPVEKKMNYGAWWDGIDVALTVCDAQGIIIWMNEQAARIFAANGGRQLIGCDLMACHPAAAREKIRAIIASRQANSYTIEKDGRRKLIHQAPWQCNGEFAGLMEFSIPLASALPHFVRSSPPVKE